MVRSLLDFDILKYQFTSLKCTTFRMLIESTEAFLTALDDEIER